MAHHKQMLIANSGSALDYCSTFFLFIYVYSADFAVSFLNKVSTKHKRLDYAKFLHTLLSRLSIPWAKYTRQGIKLSVPMHV